MLDAYLIIPCFRESERLPVFLAELLDALGRSENRVRVRVVDDGSGRSEHAKVERAVERLRGTNVILDEVFALPENRGKGAAIRAGWDSIDVPCRFLGFIDADGAVRPSGFLSLLQRALELEGEAVVAGSRRAPGGSVKRVWSREVFSELFSRLVKCRYGIEVLDTQCGCKLVSEPWYRRVASELDEEGFGLDIELLARAKRDGCVIREVGIDWEEQAGSKVGWRGALNLVSDVAFRRIGARAGEKARRPGR